MSQHRFSGKELADFARYLAQEYGISFRPSKYTFLENRVLPLMEKYKFRVLSDLLKQSKQDLVVRRDLLNELTTNETWFFRDIQHFEILKEKVLPELVKRKKEKKDNIITIWSAGSSIGAELYSILITLIENLENFSSWTLRLIGSDISTDAIQKANAALYTKQEVRMVKPKQLDAYFTRCENGAYSIKEEYKKFVNFEVLNLLDSWTFRTFDVIFCRNTMIYFNESKKTKLTERFYKSLNIGGYYFTSSNETVRWGTGKSFKRIFYNGDFIYQKAPSNKEFIMFYFNNPTDLLKALNSLTRGQFEHHLKKIPFSNSLEPKRAIYVPSEKVKDVENIFKLNKICVIKKEILIK